jgi:hypothetical protein
MDHLHHIFLKKLDRSQLLQKISTTLRLDEAMTCLSEGRSHDQLSEEEGERQRVIMEEMAFRL